MGHERHAKDDEGCGCLSFIGYILIILSVYILVCAYFQDPPATYSVAIGAVSGLDPVTDLQDGRALNPAFNLTVRVDASGRKNDGACLDESTSVQVSYLSASRSPSAGRWAVPAWRPEDVGTWRWWRAGEAWPCRGFF
jgi:hypothetical protein